MASKDKTAGRAAPAPPPADRGMSEWLVMQYRPTSLFSLRLTHSTSSGGKTLLVPTPYAVKLALVDAAFRAGGPEVAHRVFDVVKGREIRFRPPRRLVVTNTFVKLLREKRADRAGGGKAGEGKASEGKASEDDEQSAVADDDGASAGPYRRTIAYREFAYYDGDLFVACGIGGLTDSQVQLLVRTFAHITYLGKRGSFMQFIGWERLPLLAADEYTFPADDPPATAYPLGVTQYLDDIGGLDDPELFDRINTFSPKRVELNRHRVLRLTMIPYRQVSSSTHYTYYRLV